MELTMGWWIGFNVFVLAMLALDLGVFHRKAHEVRFKEAITWSAVWIALALLFGVGIHQGWFGGYDEAVRGLRAKEFFAGYLVEKALSVDNVFVFAMIFGYFAVPPAYQHRVLFFGILGALILRAIFIFGGAWLVAHFEWTLYIFAVFLIVTGIKMIWMKDKKIEPENNPLIRLTRRIMPVTTEYHGQNFFIRQDGRLFATPLLLVLLFVETTDLLFAIDSIPAILILTQDTFIVYTSNVFAILGLRALYFALAGFMQMFAYLSYGLSAILIFIGGKMFYQAAVKSMTGVETKFPIEWSLGIIGAILVIAVIASLIRGRKKPTAPGTGEPAVQ
ncbi:MAG: tellurium resistance protein TerC [Planctomycetota bacterium]